MPRNHRLRERRLKLGASQFLVGCLAGFSVTSAQSYVSHEERRPETVNPMMVKRVRSAIVWLETEPRRQREADRLEKIDAAKVEAALSAQPGAERNTIIVERLVDLLCEGRTEDFDALAARVPEDLVDRAGNTYLDSIMPSSKGDAKHASD